MIAFLGIFEAVFAKSSLRLSQHNSQLLHRRNRSEPDIASLDLSNSLSPKRGTLKRQESKSTENSPVLPRHQRNNSSDSTSSSSSSSTSSKEIPFSKRSSSPCFRSLTSRASSPPAICVSSPVRNSILSELDRGHIIRVSLEDNHDSGLLYKGVWLGQDERTLSVIQKCLQKHGLNDKPSDYFLVQQLHNDSNVEMYRGNVEMYRGVDEMYRGEDEMCRGVDEMYRGVDEMYRGVDEMYRGVDEMCRGEVEMYRGVDECTEE
ncbi:hypothetical protein AC249_AIPGENE18538 [Exaiptasia diaphana]|nr:hypothetical protein AC249_AIPGENE18538 [Exaiptasia diaphana]